MSQDVCIRMSVSIFTPNAFSIRSAMMPDRSERPFRNVESAGRDNAEHLRCGSYGETVGFDHLGPHECTR